VRVAREDFSDDELLLFARAAVGSVSALELLILLRRGQPRPYSMDELVRELRSSPLAMTHGLDHLIEFGLVERLPDGFRYRREAAELDVMCERLEQEYARKPVAIIRAILDAPNEKLRQFADAFRLSEKNK
jgi:DNA-binding IclR family transcriptional regulator